MDFFKILEKIFMIISLCILIGSSIASLAILFQPDFTSGVELVEPNLFILNSERALIIIGILGGAYIISKIAEKKQKLVFSYACLLFLFVFIFIYLLSLKIRGV
jgi:hypothetical protein